MIDKLVEKLGAYRELAYRVCATLELDEIAASNRALIDRLHSVDNRRIVYEVEDARLVVEAESDSSRLSVAHRYRGLNKRLHRIVTAQVFLSWLTGSYTALKTEEVQFAD